MHTLHDKELLSRCTHGDQAALGAIYDRYSSLLYTLTLRLTGDVPTAERILHDVFRQAWRTAGQVPPTMSIAVWLLSLTTTRIRDALPQGHAHSPEESLQIKELPAE